MKRVIKASTEDYKQVVLNTVNAQNPIGYHIVMLGDDIIELASNELDDYHWAKLDDVVNYLEYHQYLDASDVDDIVDAVWEVEATYSSEYQDEIIRNVKRIRKQYEERDSLQ